MLRLLENTKIGGVMYYGKKFLLSLFLIFLIVLVAFPKENNKKRFQFELFGGFSSLNPVDLNLKVESDEQVEKFWYDDYYTYSLDTGNIVSYNRNAEGEFKTIKQAIPFGFRFKYYLTKSIAISLGFKHISKSQVSNVRNQYTVIENSGQEYFYTTEYAPFTLSAKGLSPLIGIHFGKKIFGSIEVEGFISVGPLFGECSYAYEHPYQQLSSEGDILDESDWFIEEKGKGTGFCLDSGARININVGNNFGIFLEGGYAFRKVNKLSGPGREDRDGIIDTWGGDWGIKETNINKYWANLHSQYPSNYWEGEDPSLKVRDFKLDLSGFQVRLGVFYRL